MFALEGLWGGEVAIPAIWGELVMVVLEEAMEEDANGSPSVTRCAMVGDELEEGKLCFLALGFGFCSELRVFGGGGACRDG